MNGFASSPRPQTNLFITPASKLLKVAPLATGLNSAHPFYQNVIFQETFLKIAEENQK